MERKKILLLNPPGNKKYVRDYYCSKTSKGDYVYHPIDLLILSGGLYDHFELRVIDCIAENINSETAFQEIMAYSPAAIVFLTGAVSKDEDMLFMERIDAKLNCVIVGTGDYLLDNFSEINKTADWLDAVILDFTTDDLLKYLRKRLYNKKERFANIVDFSSKKNNYDDLRKKDKIMEIPVPRYELFPNQKYSYPFVCGIPFGTVLCSYGCPFSCKFCVMPGIGFKIRPVENVVQELDYLKTLGFTNIYFGDQTFGVNRKWLKEFCEVMIEKNYGFSWVAFSRVDLIDDEILKLMKKSGCHMLMFGLESPIQRVLDENRKGIDLNQAEIAFTLCRGNRIRTLATFIIGLPGTDYDENMQILKFAKKINPDYASFNVLVPRTGAEIATDKNIKVSGLLDQSGEAVNISTDMLTAEQIMDLKRKINKGFYFRPGYIIKRLFNIRSCYELFLLLSNGLKVFKNN